MSLRTRDMRPGYFKNEDLAKCDPLARILFAALWCLADRDGRLEDRPARIKIDSLPYDDCDVDQLLQQLADGGFIDRYESQGKKVIQVVTFLTHQKPHPKEPSKELPCPLKKTNGNGSAGKVRGKAGKGNLRSGYPLTSNTLTANPLTSNPQPLTPSAPSERIAAPPPAPPKKVPDTVHHQAVAAFCDGWQAKYGEKYLFDGGKDGKAIKALVEHVSGDLDKFRAAVAEFFADDDGWLCEHRHPLGVFRSQFQKWTVKVGSGPPKRSPAVSALSNWLNNGGENGPG